MLCDKVEIIRSASKQIIFTQAFVRGSVCTWKVRLGTCREFHIHIRSQSFNIILVCVLVKYSVNISTIGTGICSNIWKIQKHTKRRHMVNACFIPMPQSTSKGNQTHRPLPYHRYEVMTQVTSEVAERSYAKGCCVSFRLYAFRGISRWLFQTCFEATKDLHYILI